MLYTIVVKVVVIFDIAGFFNLTVVFFIAAVVFVVVALSPTRLKFSPLSIFARER